MIFSADIEDWQQSVLEFSRPVSERVVHNTQHLLDILAEHQVTGTFFVQGMVSEKYPQLIRAIAAGGHELASHAYSHRPVYSLSAAAFQHEVRQSVDSLEQVCGSKVLGFRAPSFSLRTEIIDWYCDALLAAGIRYDSSVMLAQVRKLYGFADGQIINQLESRGLDCYPLSTVKVLGKALPVMGGGYFRIYPYWLNQWLSQQLNLDQAVFYMHPYELDTTEYQQVAKPAGISKHWAVHQFAGRRRTRDKLHRLLTDYAFSSFRDHYYRHTQPCAA